MSYERSRSIRLIGLAVVILPVTVIVAHLNRERLREWYVDSVIRDCAASAGLGQVPWRDVLAFDWYVKEFHPDNEAGFATLDCVDRRAGWAFDWREESRFARSRLQVAIGGSHYAPPERIYRVGLVRNVERPRP